MAARRRSAKLDQAHVTDLRHRRLDRQRWQQGDADIGRHHLAQGFEAGRAKATPFAGAGELADLEGLIAQAMTLFEQHQVLVGEVIEHDRAVFRQRIGFRNGQHKRLVEQFLDVQLLIMDGQGEDAGVKSPFADLAQDDFCFFLDQEQLEARKAGTTCGSR
jgi:hypothetical protein